MADPIVQHVTDRTQLQQIIAGLPEGVIIINSDETIAWANEAALTMHGVRSLTELGTTVSDYRARFELRYRDRQLLPPDEYPMDRIIAGESFTELIVEVVRPGRGERHGVQRIRSLVLTDSERRADSVALRIPHGAWSDGHHRA
jgi:PAS domain-containing protein